MEKIPEIVLPNMLFFTNVIFETLDSLEFCNPKRIQALRAKSSKYLSIQSPRRGPSHLDILDSYLPSHSITTSPTANLIKEERNKDTHTLTHT